MGKKPTKAKSFKDKMKKVKDAFGITKDAEKRAVAVTYVIDVDKKKSTGDEPRMTE